MWVEIPWHGRETSPGIELARRFECDNCGERRLESHAQFHIGLSRRVARRLVNDAMLMPIRGSLQPQGGGGIGSWIWFGQGHLWCPSRCSAMECTVTVEERPLTRRRSRSVRG